MKIRLLHIVVLSLIFVISSCKKDPLPVLPNQNNPYYSISGLLDVDSINYFIGIDNVTILHGVGNMNGVKSYYGELKAPNDQFSIKIEIIKPELENNESGFNPLDENSIPYLKHSPGCVLFKFGSVTDQINYFLVKDEMDQFVIMDQVEYEEFGIYEMTVKFTDITSGPEVFHVPVKYGFEDAELYSGFQSYGSDDTLMLSPYIESGEHEWYVDGAFVSDDMIYSGYVEDGVHEVKHVVKDEFGNEQEFSTLIKFQLGELYWQMSYDYCTPMNDPNNYYQAIITVEKDGKTYTSSSSVNENLDIENLVYVRNSEYQIIWAIYDFEFDAMLMNNVLGDSLSLSGIAGTFNLGLN